MPNYISRAGLFIHKVKHGEKVAKGQVPGQVIDIEDGVLIEIRSLFDSCVVVLKRRPHVKPGDQAVCVAIPAT